MKVFTHSQFISRIFLLFTSKCLCEIPIANNFWSVPEYGQLSSKVPNNHIIQTTSNFEETKSLETSSSMPSLKFNDGKRYLNSKENDDYYNDEDHGTREELGYSSDEGRGFEESSIIRFLMSPLKPFRFKLPSVFRRSKKGRRRNRPPSSKGRRDRESRYKGAKLNEDEFDLHVDSDSSTGHRRKKKRGRSGWRSKGRSHRRRKPRWRKRRRPRTKPQYSSDEDDEYDEYDGDDHKNSAPLKVTHSEPYYILHQHKNGKDDNPHNFHQYKQSDLHKSKEKSTLRAPQASSFWQDLKKATNNARIKFYGGNSAVHNAVEHLNVQNRHLPRSIYDKLPQSAAPTTQYTPYIAPPDHPMRIMRPPIPPVIMPFSQSYNNQYFEDGSSVHSEGNNLKNDELGTPSASINSPKFPQPFREMATSQPYEDALPPYMSPPRPFSKTIANFPGMIPKQLGFVRYYTNRNPSMFRFSKGLHHNIPGHHQHEWASSNKIYSAPPPPAPTLSQNTHNHQIYQHFMHNGYQDQYNNFPGVSPEPGNFPSTEDHNPEENPPELQPQIIYGKWNPLLDKMEESINTRK